MAGVGWLISELGFVGLMSHACGLLAAAVSALIKSFRRAESIEIARSRDDLHRAAAADVTATTTGKQPAGTVRVLSQNVWCSFFAGGPDRHARLAALRDYVARESIDVLLVLTPQTTSHEQCEI